MSTENWMQLLVVAVLSGAFVSTSTHAVLSRVRTPNPSSAPHQWSPVGSSIGPNNRDAARELARLITLDPSRIDLAFTKDQELHCSIQAGPDELLELAKAAEVAIDPAFRERHRWTDLRVVLHLEAGPSTSACQASDN